jgi:GNAT superfamily N-acetyltransferase
MKKENLEKINRFLAENLGCPDNFLENPESEIFVRRETTMYNEGHGKNGVDIFVRNGEKILSCHSDFLGEVQRLEKFLPELEVSKASFEGKGLKVEEFHGPAFLGFVDEQSFQPVESDARKLDEKDLEQVSGLKEKGNDEEIQNSIEDFHPEEDIGFGKFVDGRLVALSSFQKWGDDIAFISVFVSQEFRGKGFGKEMVSRACEKALNEGLIPCYRTLEEWESSVNLAKILGFEKYAITYLVKLEE